MAPKKRYESNASKQKAYRERKKAEQERRQALSPSDPGDLRAFKGPDPK